MKKNNIYLVFNSKDRNDFRVIKSYSSESLPQYDFKHGAEEITEELCYIDMNYFEGNMFMPELVDAIRNYEILERDKKIDTILK